MRTTNAHDLKQRLESGGQTAVIDVLPEENYQAGHIPGAKSAPLGSDRFLAEVESVTSGKDQPVVVYCANTECDLSPKAAQRLEQAGFTDVADFEGGIEEWKAAGFETSKR